MLYDARKFGAKLVMYGHTHRVDCRQESDGIWVLNPGSAGKGTVSAGMVKTERISISRIIAEAKPGTKFGNFVPQMYDKELNAQKYRLICDAPDGRIVRLRSVMSEAKHDIMSSSADGLFDTVTYGKLTHVVISYNGLSGSGLTDMF